MGMQVNTRFIRGVVLSAAHCHNVDVEEFCVGHVDLYTSGEFDADNIVVGVESDIEFGDAICVSVNDIEFNTSYDTDIMRVVNTINAEVSRRNGAIGYVPCQHGDIRNLVFTSLR